MSKKGTALYRLEQAVGGKTGKVEVAVFAGDLIDCGGDTPELKAVRPGELVNIAAGAVRKLCSSHKESSMREQDQNAEDQKSLEEKDEMIRLQDEEIKQLKADAEALKKKDPPK